MTEGKLRPEGIGCLRVFISLGGGSLGIGFLKKGFGFRNSSDSTGIGFFTINGFGTGLIMGIGFGTGLIIGIGLIMGIIFGTGLIMGIDFDIGL